MNQPKLFITDKNPLELIGLKTILSDCSIRVHSEDLIVNREMIAILEEWAPQAILADVVSYDRDIDTFTRTVRRNLGIPVLWLTPSNDKEFMIDAVIAGAAGCVPKDDFQMIADALSAILADGVFFPVKVLADFAFDVGLFSPPNGRHIKDLTDKEREIFMLMREGATNCQIASELNISVETVKAHIRSIRHAYGALSKRQLVPQVTSL
jgi:DNA-binding NarL/FixJ family response regulator